MQLLLTRGLSLRAARKQALAVQTWQRHTLVHRRLVEILAKALAHVDKKIVENHWSCWVCHVTEGRRTQRMMATSNSHLARKQLWRRRIVLLHWRAAALTAAKTVCRSIYDCRLSSALPPCLKTLPLPCVSTAFVPQDTVFALCLHCHRASKHCLCLVFPLMAELQTGICLEHQKRHGAETSAELVAVVARLAAQRQVNSRFSLINSPCWMQS